MKKENCLNIFFNSRLNFYIAPLAFIFSVFFIIPFEIYYKNQIYWNYKKFIPINIALFGLILYIIFVILITLLFKIQKEKIAKCIAAILCYLGVFVLLSDVFSPVQTNLATGEKLASSEPLINTLIELSIFGCIILFLCKKNLEDCAKIGTIIGAILTIIAFSYFIFIIGTSKPEIQKDIKKVSVGKKNRGNIYHIVLDEMQTDAALIYMKEKNNSVKYNGFTVFRNNCANYLNTHASFPSYITGSFFNKGSFEYWFKGIFKEQGLFKTLFNQGYNVRLFAYSYNWNNSFVDEFISLNDFYERITNSKNREYVDFIQILSARVMPNFWTTESLLFGKKFGLFIYENLLLGKNKQETNIPVAYEDGKEPYSSVELFKHMIKTEKERPANGQYIYMHAVLPHPPYVYNELGEYNLKYRDTGVKGYYGQVKYAFLIIEEFINELKRLGRFQNSTIIIHADTGHGQDGFILKKNGKVISTLNKNNSEEVVRLESLFKRSDNLPERLANSLKDNILSRLKAFLMIKPKMNIEPLQYSERLTQLVDVYPTICKLESLNVLKNEKINGINVFSNKFPKERPLEFFWFPQRDLEPLIAKLAVINPDRISQLKKGDLQYIGYINSHEVKPFPEDGIKINIGSPIEWRLKLYGFGGSEIFGENDYYRWAVDKKGKLVLSGLRIKKNSTIKFNFNVKPYIVNENRKMVIQTTLSKKEVILTPGINEYSVKLHFQTDIDPSIEIIYEDAISPASLGVGKDIRKLAALWTNVSFEYNSKNIAEKSEIHEKISRRNSLDEGIFYNIGAWDEKDIVLKGFGKRENNNKGSWRWAIGKHSKIVFHNIKLKEATNIIMELKVIPFKSNANKEIRIETKQSKEKIILKPGLGYYKVPLIFSEGEKHEVNIFYPSHKNPEFGIDKRRLAALWSEIKLIKP